MFDRRPYYFFLDIPPFPLMGHQPLKVLANLLS